MFVKQCRPDSVLTGHLPVALAEVKSGDEPGQANLL